MSLFASIMHIFGRYPELANDNGFLAWLAENGGGAWHEQRATEDGHVIVIVQSDNRLNLFAALIQRDFSDADKGVIRNKVIRTTKVDLAEQGSSPQSAVSVLRKKVRAASSQIHALRPVVDLYSEESKVSWEIEIIDSNAVQTFNVDDSETLSRLDVRKIQKTKYVSPAKLRFSLANDWLEENECHHLSAWRSVAAQIADGSKIETPADKARAVYQYLNKNLYYCENITHIKNFTWSDNLTINQNDWRGICDEWAVVQITFLRALGVPAVMKFLVWQPRGQSETVGHACVEWSDNGTWRHMDALYNAFDNKSCYRNDHRAQNVTVMDASFPLDSRYNDLAWSVPDALNDEKFHPYRDFIINPVFPGNQRPGYSY